jgi:hypothetical protein
MERYLMGRPSTILKQSKFNRDRSKKYEYRCCICGCEFWLLVIVDDSNGGIYKTRESTIPESHDPISEMVPPCHRMDKQVSMLIVQMLEQNQFTKNFGPKRIISELQRQNILEDRIPSRIQIQNQLLYHCRSVYNFNNEITLLQTKARLSVFNCEEAPDQPFVFVYDVSNSNQWVMIDRLSVWRFVFLFCLCIRIYPTSDAKIRFHIHIPLTIMSFDSIYRLILGDGSDGHPFIISMMTKSLLSVLNSVSASQIPSVLQMDSTFKCNENEFPVTLLGVSDAQRQIHLLYINIVSHHTLAV